MKYFDRIRISGTLVIVGVLMCAGVMLREQAIAQNTGEGAAADRRANRDAGKKAPKPEPKELPPDEYQRSAQVLYMERMGKSGADRGQEIYYMKCWMCHNDYTRKVDPKAAPTLKGLFTRAKLVSGAPVNDETVMKWIKEGSAGMPAYQAGLSDKDLADLMTYLKEKCCWDENNPPANPRYRYTQQQPRP